MGRPRPVVGMLWSTVATVRSGRRTPLDASLSPSKAWGDVTSCMRCLSIYIREGPVSFCIMVWASQTFSNSVRAILFWDISKQAARVYNVPYNIRKWFYLV